MDWIFGTLLVFSLLSVGRGLGFDCFGKCQCYPEYKIIQCPTGLRNQLGLTAKADIEGFQVNDLKHTLPEKEFRVVPEGTFKTPTTKAPTANRKNRPRRDLEDKIHRFKMWLIDFRRKIQNTSGRH
ncbi:unnamed protein product [Caenorhabditis brenneri]